MYEPRPNQQMQLAFQECDSGAIVRNGSGFSDPAFVGNKALPIHRWVPWIAGFSASFVKDAIERSMNGGGLVLDPFCGVGTTLVEAKLQGYDSVGFEINPFAALASRVKVNASMITPDRLDAEISRFASFYTANSVGDYEPSAKPPKGFRTRTSFYSPAVLRKVLVSWDFFNSINDQRLSDVFRLAFAATMISYSNYSYEPSLGTRESAGKDKINDFPVGEKLLGRLREMLEDVIWLRKNFVEPGNSARIINDSFFKSCEYLGESTVDLVVTSPPYLNNYHYNRNTRPQLYWLGYANAPHDMMPLEESNFGKYWQTVRQHPCVSLAFTLPDCDLSEKLGELRRTNPHKGVYGGNGWANYAAAYFNDCLRFANGIRHLLKPGGTALVVLGNSILQGVFIPTDEYFARIAQYAGLDLVDIHVPRATRTGNSIIQSGVRVAKAAEHSRLYESVVELRRC